MKLNDYRPLLTLLKQGLPKHLSLQELKHIPGALPGGGQYRVTIDNYVSIHFSTLNQPATSGYNLRVEPAPETASRLYVNDNMLDPLIEHIGRPVGRHQWQLQRDVLRAINALASMEIRGLDLDSSVVSIQTFSPDCWNKVYSTYIRTEKETFCLQNKCSQDYPSAMFVNYDSGNPNNIVLRTMSDLLKANSFPSPLEVMRECVLLEKIGITQILTPETKQLFRQYALGKAA